MHTDVVSNSSISQSSRPVRSSIPKYMLISTSSYIRLSSYVYLYSYISYGVKCSFTGHTSVPLLLLASYRNLIFQHQRATEKSECPRFQLQNFKPFFLNNHASETSPESSNKSAKVSLTFRKRVHRVVRGPCLIPLPPRTRSGICSITTSFSR